MDRTRAGTLAAIGVVVVAVTALRGVVAASGWFYWDDLILHGLGAQHAWPGPDLLLHAHDGHLMPGGMLLAWIAAHAAPLQFWMPVAQLVVLHLLAAIALARLLWVLLDGRRVLLVPLVWLLAVPLSLPASTWWAAALNSLPLIATMAWAATDAVLAARTGRRRHVVGGVLAVAVGLFFVEKALLVPVFAALVALAWWYVSSPDDPSRPTLAGLWGRTKLLWFGAAAVVVVWAATYLVVIGNPVLADSVRPTGQGGSSFLGLVDHTYRLAVAPTLAGGPWTWERWHPSPPWAAPGPLAIFAGIMVVVVVIGWSLRSRRRTALIWAAALAYPLLSVVAISVVRGGQGTALEIVQTLRYHDDAIVVFAAALALAMRAPARPLGWAGALAPGSAGSAESGSAASESAASGGAAGSGTADEQPVATNAVRAAGAGVVVLVLISSAVSTITYRAAWSDQPARDYAGPLVENLREYGKPVLDQELPLEVLLPVARPANTMSYMLRGVPDLPPIGDWTTDAVLVSPQGERLPAQVINGRDIVEGPEPGCGYRVEPGGTRLGLDGPLIDRDWIVTLNYFAGADGTLEIRFDTGSPVTVPVSSGLSTVYVRVVGGGSGVTVRALEGADDLCIGQGPVGVLVPQ